MACPQWRQREPRASCRLLSSRPRAQAVAGALLGRPPQIRADERATYRVGSPQAWPGPGRSTSQIGWGASGGAGEEKKPCELRWQSGHASHGRRSARAYPGMGRARSQIWHLGPRSAGPTTQSNLVEATLPTGNLGLRVRGFVCPTLPAAYCCYGGHMRILTTTQGAESTRPSCASDARSAALTCRRADQKNETSG